MQPHNCKGEGCFGCKIKSVSFAASAMPTRHIEASSNKINEKQLVRDRNAFKALKDEGIQPARLRGAAELQDKATTKHEIETGKILPKSIAGKVESTVKELANK